MEERIVEAYVGEYASGKSENAVNRAMALHKQGMQVTLVDLDTVEPCYTLRPLKRMLETAGLQVIAWDNQDAIGLGEAGCMLKGEMRWVLRRPGNIIMDIGYGAHGAAIFNLVEGAWEDTDLRIFAVINASRPMTSSVAGIVDYVRTLGRIDGLINNTHMAEETTRDIVERGGRLVAEAACLLNTSVVATSALYEIAGQIGKRDRMGNPVWPLYRYMPKSFW